MKKTKPNPTPTPNALGCEIQQNQITPNCNENNQEPRFESENTSKLKKSSNCTPKTKEEGKNASQTYLFYLYEAHVSFNHQNCHFQDPKEKTSIV